MQSLTSKVILSIFPIFILGLLTLSGEVVLGQEATTTESVILPTATTTDSVEEIQVSRISGNDINVGDYVVGPGKMEVEIKPGESITTYVSVTNRMSDGRKFELSVEDMSGSADGSQNVVLLGDKNGPYSLKDYISFPESDFELNLGDRARVPVTVSVPPNAEPGGYYGAVLISTLQNDYSKTAVGAPQTPIIARIGTLFFIRVLGEAKTSGSLVDFSTKNNQIWYQKGPIDLNILFENTGSVHLNVYGEIRVTNILGEEVGFVELDPWFVLPQSLRLREVIWDRELLLGRYTVTTKINRGYDNIIDEKTIHFWVLPWTYIALSFTTLFLIIIFIRFVFRTFEFRRRV